MSVEYYSQYSKQALETLYSFHMKNYEKFGTKMGREDLQYTLKQISAIRDALAKNYSYESVHNADKILYEIEGKKKHLGHAPPSRLDYRREREYPNGKNQLRKTTDSSAKRVWTKWCAFWQFGSKSKDDPIGDSKS